MLTQINFKASKKVTGIATQGKVDLFEPAWVKEYRIQYKDHHYWYWYKDGQVSASGSARHAFI